MAKVVVSQFKSTGDMSKGNGGLQRSIPVHGEPIGNPTVLDTAGTLTMTFDAGCTYVNIMSIEGTGAVWWNFGAGTPAEGSGFLLQDGRDWDQGLWNYAGQFSNQITIAAA